MIKITEDGNLVYENEPESPRDLLPNARDGGIQDVQVNGSSIVNAAGVADLPIGTETRPGLTMPRYGLRINAAGAVDVEKASDPDIKQSAGDYSPIVPANQHASVFYGLAKVSGDATQAASSNSVGNYTESAKASIRAMIGAASKNEYELIADITTSSNVTELKIDTDNNNESFRLKELILIAVLGAPTTSKADVFNSSYKVRVRGASEDSYIGNASIQYPDAGSGMLFRCQAQAIPSAPFIVKMSCAVNAAANAAEITRIKTEIVDYITEFFIARSSSAGSSIPAGSNFKIYGIRY